MVENSTEPVFLERTVYRDDAKDGRAYLPALDLWKQTLPVVLIGDPGMGKSFLTESLVAANPAAKWVKAGAFVRNPQRYALSDDKSCLVIDGLDEVAARAEGDPLHNVLTSLGSIGAPPFILSCRAADWRNAADGAEIAADYNAAPQVWTLAPLSETEARKFCQLEGLDETATEKLLEHVTERGLGDLVENPLTLRLLAEVALAEGDLLPETRKDLYETAVGLICREAAPERQNAPLNHLARDTALDAAGATCAALILSGSEDISKEGLATEQGGTLQLPEIERLVDPELSQVILTSRLFKIENTVLGRFAPIHRTVAEYLGARWLVRRLSGSRLSRRRFMSLLSRDGVVPASFRGLHAWLAMSTEFAPDIIATDPYGVLIYGDGDSLGAEEGRMVLSALSSLETEDPFFRAGAWSLRSAGCLTQPALENDLRKFLHNPKTGYQLRSLILEALNGSQLSRNMVSDLEAIALDEDMSYRERVEAADGLARAVSETWDPTDFITSLHVLENESSTRLTVHSLEEFGLDYFPAKLIADCILAHLGYLPGRNSNAKNRTSGMFWSLKRELPIEKAPAILNYMCDAIDAYSDLHRNSDHGWEGWFEIRYLTQTLVRRVLESGFDGAISIARWAMTFEAADHGDDEDRKFITDHFQLHTDLRQKVQHQLIFGANEDADGIPIYKLRRYSAGLWPSLEDAIVHLKALNGLRSYTDENRHTWRGLVNLARDKEGIDAAALEIAEIAAARDAELYHFLHPDPNAEPPAWKIHEEEAERRFAERRAKEEREELDRLERYREKEDAIRDGTSSELIVIADMYLGRYTNVDRERPHRERLAQWMRGDTTLIDAALEGFEHSISRDDLPTAEEIAESSVESKRWSLCPPLLAGLNEKLAAGKDFAEIDVGIRQAAWSAINVELLNNERDLAALAQALQASLRAETGAWEEALRIWFETHFRVRKEQPTGLYGFIRNDPDPELVGRLCTDWLRQFPDLDAATEKELVQGSIRTAGARRSDSFKFLTEQADIRLSSANELNDAKRLLWRSIAFVTAFDRRELWEASANDRDFIWEVRRRIGYSNEIEDEDMTLDAAQAAWIVSSFRRLWPVAKYETYKRGDATPFDASQFLQRLIYDLSVDSTDEACEALFALVEAPEDGYTDQLKAALANQQRKRVESKFEPLTPATLANAVDNRPPQQHADLQAYILSAIEALQEKIQGDSVDIISRFYEDNEEGAPRVENDCRSLFLGLLHLEHGIEGSPEVAMPGSKRADCGFRLNDMVIPLEAKGQWHSKVWTAAQTQLDEDYAIDHKAAGYGIYLVFWFGANVPQNRRLCSPPRGERLPNSTSEMAEQLEARIAKARRDGIKVFVLDLERS
tara:strand:- start:621 stop:4706 length:4086 start_codon:yes stop_codon:yes gene_type:complete